MTVLIKLRETGTIEIDVVDAGAGIELSGQVNADVEID